MALEWGSLALQVAVDITSNLFQIQSHRGDLMIAGQMDVPHRVFQLFRSFHEQYYSMIPGEKSMYFQNPYCGFQKPY